MSQHETEYLNYTDSLDAAERLFLTWMRHFDKLEGLRALVDAVGDRESLKKNSEYKLGNVPPVEELKNNFPSMDSWHSLMSMYAGRHAGYSCKAVFDFLRLLDQRLILIKDTATDDHVMLNGYKIPLNVKADDKIYKDYIRALCGTESFKTAFGVLKEMIIDKKMEPDGHVIASLLKMVNKPGLVRDDAVPQVCNLTVELIRSMHHLDQVSRESNSEQPVSKTRSSDACLVLNVLVSVMCNRGEQ